MTLNGAALSTSDGAAVSEEHHLEIVAGEFAEIMLYDLYYSYEAPVAQ